MKNRKKGYYFDCVNNLLCVKVILIIKPICLENHSLRCFKIIIGVSVGDMGAYVSVLVARASVAVVLVVLLLLDKDFSGQNFADSSQIGRIFTPTCSLKL